MLEVWLGVVDLLQAAALSLPLNIFQTEAFSALDGKKRRMQSHEI
jgi:hypothetical protein